MGRTELALLPVLVLGVLLLPARPATARGWDWAGTASFTVLTGEGYPEGMVENDIQVDVIHLKIVAEPTDWFYLSIAPCLAHPGMSFMLMHAFLGLAAPSPLLNLEVGQILVPFGRVNYLSEPGNMPVRSRPYMYEDLCTPDLPHRTGFGAPIAATALKTAMMKAPKMKRPMGVAKKPSSTMPTNPPKIRNASITNTAICPYAAQTPIHWNSVATTPHSGLRILEMAM